jgi:hypothetical protein
MNIEAKPFAENQQEQICMLPVRKFCSNLPLDNLKGFSAWCRKLLETNYRLTEKRKDLICSTLDQRISLARNLLVQGVGVFRNVPSKIFVSVTKSDKSIKNKDNDDYGQGW